MVAGHRHRADHRQGSVAQRLVQPRVIVKRSTGPAHAATRGRPRTRGTLTTPWEKLIKIGAKVVHQAKVVTFQLAEVAVPRALFAAILARIGRL